MTTNIIRQTIAANAYIDSERVRVDTGHAPIFYVYTEGSATAQVFRRTAEGDLRAHGPEFDVTAGDELPIPVDYILRDSVIRITDTSGSPNLVIVDQDSGPV